MIDSATVLMKREVKGLKILKKLKGLPIKIPSLIDFGIFPKNHALAKHGIGAWTLTSRLSGKCVSFKKLMNYPKAIDDLGKFLAFLHSHTSKIKILGRIQAEKSIEEMSKNTGAKSDERIVRSLANRVKNLELANLTLIHGDINASNILIHKGRVSGIVDFAEMNYDFREFDWCHAMFVPEFAHLLQKAYYRHGGQMLDSNNLYLMAAVNETWNMLADESTGRHEAAKKVRKKLIPLLTKIGIK
jgi:aminoglycoside phosphotransferase (APT) family kinase protein